jgi:hypothetical protein
MHEFDSDWFIVTSVSHAPILLVGPEELTIAASMRSSEMGLAQV